MNILLELNHQHAVEYTCLIKCISQIVILAYIILKNLPLILEILESIEKVLVDSNPEIWEANKHYLMACMVLYSQCLEYSSGGKKRLFDSLYQGHHLFIEWWLIMVSLFSNGSSTHIWAISNYLIS